jgi:hypothetical protein
VESEVIEIDSLQYDWLTVSFVTTAWFAGHKIMLESRNKIDRTTFIVRSTGFKCEYDEIVDRKLGWMVFFLTTQ